MSQPSPELENYIKRALVARAHYDDAACQAAMVGITDLGNQALLVACVCWAQYVNDMVGGKEPGFVSVDMRDPLGRLIEPEDAPPTVRPKLWAARFIAAIGNDDADTAAALYKAAGDDIPARGEPDPNPEQRLAAGVFTLLDVAAECMRSAHRPRRRWR